MAYDTWGNSWGSTWAVSWTRSSTTPAITSKGGFSDYKFDKREKERLARLRMQQSRIRDDDEALAIILASLTRR